MRGPEGRNNWTKFYTARFRPEVQAHTLYIPSLTEKVPHSYLPLKNGTPLTYLLNTNKSLKHEVFLSFNFRVTFEVLKWYGHKARLFETIQLKNLFLYLKSIEVPTLSYENSLPFDILETWKNVPLSGVAKANTDRKCPSTRECRAVAFEKKLLSIFGTS